MPTAPYLSVFFINVPPEKVKILLILIIIIVNMMTNDNDKRRDSQYYYDRLSLSTVIF